MISKKMKKYIEKKDTGYVNKDESNSNSYLNFNFGENRKEKSSMIIEKLSEINISKLISNYPDPTYSKIKKVICELNAVSEKEVSVGSGSNELIGRIATLFLNQEDIVVILHPTFYRFKDACRRVGAEIKEIFLDKKNNFEINESIIEKIISHKPKLLWLCNPNNPIGNEIKKELIEKIVNLLPDTLIVVDEAYIEYLEDYSSKSSVSLIKKNPNVIVLKTFSKMYGLAGLRTGYAIANENIIKSLDAIRLEFPINSLSEEIIPLVIKNTDVKLIKKEIEFEKNRIMKEIIMHSCYEFIPSETNIFILKHKEKSIFNELKKRKILSSNLNNCKGIENENYVRITVQSNSSMNDKLILVLRDIAKTMKKGKIVAIFPDSGHKYLSTGVFE